MGGRRGNQVFHKSQPKQSQFPLEGLQIPPFFFSPKSSNALSGKHHREPKERSVAEQELREGLPPCPVLLVLCQLAAAVPGWQAGGGGLPAGQTQKGCGKGTKSLFYGGATGLRYRRIEEADEIRQEGRGRGEKELKQKEPLAGCQQRQPQLVAIW